jgi:hypothetical protein
MFREEPQVFIALPQEASSADLRRAIEETLKENRVTATSSDSANDPTVLLGVQDRIRDTDFMIADVTGANPNVMIEVGMALGMGKRILLLSRARSTELPVGLAAQQVAVYRPDNLSSVRQYVQLWLRDAMSERESSTAS